MKIRYLFPNGLWMLVMLLSAMLFSVITGLIAESNFDEKVVFKGECTITTANRKIITDCGQHKDSYSTTSSEILWKAIEKPKQNCSIFETYKKHLIFRCE